MVQLIRSQGNLGFQGQRKCFLLIALVIVEDSELIYEDALNNSHTKTDTTKQKHTNGTSTDEPLRTITNNNSGNKRPMSNVLHISNLTRPFTVPQLKELLTKFGALLPNPKSETKEQHFFWINSVKSHCFVAFETEQSAKDAREGLNHITWPQSNPKQLHVDFSNMDDINFVCKHNDLPHLKHQNGDRDLKKNNITENSAELISESSKIAKNIREWDIPKLAAQATEKRSNGDRTVIKGEDEPRKKLKTSEDDKPPKTLDDLFRKTETTPHIYWLPLTEEQYQQKELEFQKRQAERATRLEQRKLEDAKKEVSCWSRFNRQYSTAPLHFR